MTLAQLQIFLTLTQTGSFTKTGETLGMSQSAVSHAVASLESEFGISLIVRERRNSLTLSSAGKQLVIHIREIIRRVGLMTEEIAAMKGIEAGTIRVGSTPTASTQLLPRILTAFQKSHPDIEATFVEGSSEEIEDWISIHAVDAGLVISSEPLMNDDTLAMDPFVAVLPRAFPCNGCETIPLNDLRKEPFILVKSEHGTLFLQTLLEKSIDLSAAYEVRDILTAFAMVQEGLGYTVVPKSFIANVDISAVQVCHVEPATSISLRLITPPSEELSPNVRAFAETAKTIFAQT